MRYIIDTLKIRRRNGPPKNASFIIYPTYSEIFKKGQEEILAQLSTVGLAEKYIVFTTSLSALLYASHIKGMHVQKEIMIEFKDAICNTTDGLAILDWLISNDLETLNFNNFTLMELYCILLKYKNGNCINTSMSINEKLTYLKLVFIANENRLDKTNDFHNNLNSITPKKQLIIMAWIRIL